MADPFVRAATTIQKYAKGWDDAISRRRIIWALLKKFGRITYNHGGDQFSWQIKFGQATSQDNNGAQTFNPTSVDRYRQFTLDYEGSINGDRITKRERLKNKDSKAQLIDVMDQMNTNLMDDLENTSIESFFIDGPANPGKMSGFQSFTAYTQTLQNGATTPTARTANAADPLGSPDDSYGGQDTDLASLGGSWTSGDYRTGTGTPQYDATSPIIVRTQSTFFGGSTWDANSVEAIKLGVMLNLRQKPAMGGTLDTVLMDGTSMFYPLSNRLDLKERTIVSDAWKLPHFGADQDKACIYIDGVKCTWDFTVPANKAFGINWNAIEFRSMQDKLFKLDQDSPEWISRERSWICIVDFLGQWKFNTPRNFVLYDNSY